ncbi:hypothetical protein SELMODRAFT_412808 [Selaginella moellendorffii]|uniref:Uncharacterized protein n=1 Tax=Selaginella moellendorffii TaxID=88036 RepID=D8RMD0_SELML|nr:hypothetical protein SELMODRAFT_412808 [Selaginella moellendorffii]
MIQSNSIVSLRVFATGRERLLGITDKFIKNCGKRLRNIWRYIAANTGLATWTSSLIHLVPKLDSNLLSRLETWEYKSRRVRSRLAGWKVFTKSIRHLSAAIAMEAFTTEEDSREITSGLFQVARGLHISSTVTSKGLAEIADGIEQHERDISLKLQVHGQLLHERLVEVPP